MKKIIWFITIVLVASIIWIKFVTTARIDNVQIFTAVISSRSDLSKLMVDIKENVSKATFDEIYGGQWLDSELKPHIGFTSFDYDPYISEIVKNDSEIFVLVNHSVKDMLNFWNTVFTPGFIAEYNIKGIALDEKNNALDVGLSSSSALFKFHDLVNANKDRFYINISTHIMGDVEEENINSERP